MKRLKPSTPLAIMRVQDAMAEVERAQQCLDRALQFMSNVRRGGPAYSAMSQEYRRVKALWYRLQKLSKWDGLSLDSEPEKPQRLAFVARRGNSPEDFNGGDLEDPPDDHYDRDD